MKKKIILLFCFTLAFALIGCVQTTTSFVTVTTTSTETPTEVTTATTTEAPTTTTTVSTSEIDAIVSGLSNPFDIALFLTDTPSDSIGINFQMPVDEQGYVEYGPLDDTDVVYRIEATDKTRAIGKKTAYLYEATLPSLVPGTEYRYRVTNADGSDASAYHTFTFQGNQGPFTFMYLADPQESAITGYMAYAYSILNVLATSGANVDFAMFPGDLVNDADVKSEWDWFFQYSSLFSYDTPMVSAIGNHEVNGLDGTSIQAMEFDGYLNLPSNGPTYGSFTELTGDLRTATWDDGKTYSFDYGSVHFTVIDTEMYCDGTTACTDYDHANAAILNQWVANDLSGTNQPWKIVLMHRGPYALSYNTASVRDNLVSIFEANHVDLVISGHDHQYSRSVYWGGDLVAFERSNPYPYGTVSLIPDSGNRDFNNYLSTSGVTYLVGNTSGTKFYGSNMNSGIAVNYEFKDDNPVIPIITVDGDSIHVVSYGLAKTSSIQIKPDSVYVLEDFIITKPTS